MTSRSFVMPILIGLFAASAAIKSVSGIGGAMAQIPVPVAAEMATASEPPVVDLSPGEPDRGSNRRPATAGGESSAADWIPELVVDLRRREEALAMNQRAQDAREQALLDAETRISQQIAALDAAEQALMATMALADRAAETDLQRLTAVFEAMRPEQAAQVVAEMAPEFAAGLIGQLRPEIAAAIFSGLEPRQAYALSAILAGRNAQVPRR